MYDYSEDICEAVLYEAGIINAIKTSATNTAKTIGSSAKNASVFAGIMSGITLLSNVLNNKLQYADKLAACNDDECENQIKKEIRKLNMLSVKEAAATFGMMAITSTLIGWIGMPAYILMNVIPIFFNKNKEQISDEQKDKYNEKLIRVENRNIETLEKLKAKKPKTPEEKRRTNEAIQMIQKDLSKIRSMKK